MRRAEPRAEAAPPLLSALWVCDDVKLNRVVMRFRLRDVVATEHVCEFESAAALLHHARSVQPLERLLSDPSARVCVVLDENIGDELGTDAARELLQTVRASIAPDEIECLSKRLLLVGWTTACSDTYRARAASAGMQCVYDKLQATDIDAMHATVCKWATCGELA